MVVERPVVRTVHKITLLEQRARSIFKTVCGIAPAGFLHITSTMEKTEDLLQHPRVLEDCTVIAAAGVLNHLVGDVLVQQVDDLEV